MLLVINLKSYINKIHTVKSNLLFILYFFKGRRNSRQPNDKMQEILKKTIEDARTMISKVINFIKLIIK